jgi:photosystem II stability/assembly factor-like uncharacterized protein
MVLVLTAGAGCGDSPTHDDAGANGSDAASPDSGSQGDQVANVDQVDAETEAGSGDVGDGGCDQADCAEPDAEVVSLPDALTLQVSDAIEIGTPLAPSTNAAAGLAFEWAFGDGTSSTRSAPVHAYAQPGTYQLEVRVFDSFGHSLAASATVNVSVPARVEGLVCSGGGWTGWCEQRTNTQRFMPEGDVEMLEFVDQSFGWMTIRPAAADHSEIWHTEDGGRHWAVQKRLAPQANVRQLVFTDRLHGWAVDGAWYRAASSAGPFPALYRTANGGATWTEIDPPSAHLNSKSINGTISDGFRQKILTVDGPDIAHLPSYNRPDYSVPAPAMITRDGGKTWTEDVEPPNCEPSWTPAAARWEWEAQRWRVARCVNGQAVTLLTPSCDISLLTCGTSEAHGQGDHAVAIGTLPVNGSADPRGPLKKMVWVTNNGGASWNATEAPWLQYDFDHGGMLGEVFSASARVAWYRVSLPNNHELVYRTADGGLTWSEVNFPVRFGHGSLVISGENDLVIVLFGTRWVSKDGGTHWAAIPDLPTASTKVPGISYGWRSDGWLYDFDLRRVEKWTSSAPMKPTYAWSEQGLAFTSDGGSHWTNGVGIDARDLVDHIETIAVRDVATVVAVTYRGQAFYTNDGGITWNRSAGPGVEGVRGAPSGLHWLSNGHVLTVHAGAAFDSGDGGSTWRRVTLPGPGSELVALSAGDGPQVWLLARDGVTYSSGDAGVTWARHASMGAPASVVHGLSSESAFVVLADGSVWRTTNAGDAWTADADKLEPVQSMSFVNGQKGWILHTSGTLTRTYDGGTAWEATGGTCPVDAGRLCGSNCIAFADDDHGWCLSDTNGDHDTLDGGATWRRLGWGGLDVVAPLSGLAAWAGADANRIYTTVTGG